MRPINAKSALLAVPFLLSMACSATSARGDPQAVPLSVIVDDSKLYDQKVVAVIACLNVTTHTMTLESCETHRYQVDFEKVAGYEQPYKRLVDYGFNNLGAKPSELPIEIVGIYNNADGQTHTIRLKSVRFLDQEKQGREQRGRR